MADGICLRRLNTANTFVAVGSGDRIICTEDHENDIRDEYFPPYTTFSGLSDFNWDLTYSNGRFYLVAVGSNAPRGVNVFYSIDGTMWTRMSHAFPNQAMLNLISNRVSIIALPGRVEIAAVAVTRGYMIFILDNTGWFAIESAELRQTEEILKIVMSLSNGGTMVLVPQLTNSSYLRVFNVDANGGVYNTTNITPSYTSVTTVDCINDGTYTILVTAQKNAGNMSPRTVVYIGDNLPLIPALLSDTEGYEPTGIVADYKGHVIITTKGNNGKLTFESNDHGATWTICMNGGVNPSDNWGKYLHKPIVYGDGSYYANCYSELENGTPRGTFIYYRRKGETYFSEGGAITENGNAMAFSIQGGQGE